jgi:arylsulfatase A-like enzyme
VRKGDWKALRLKPDGPLTLHHLPTDPQETTDVAASHPEAIATIEDDLKGARTDFF